MMNELQKSFDCHDLTQSPIKIYKSNTYIDFSRNLKKISELQTLLAWGQQTPFGRQTKSSLRPGQQNKITTIIMSC